MSWVLLRGTKIFNKPKACEVNPIPYPNHQEWSHPVDGESLANREDVYPPTGEHRAFLAEDPRVPT